MNEHHFIKNPAFSAAKVTVNESGLIIFDCQIIVFCGHKHCLLFNYPHLSVLFLFRIVINQVHTCHYLSTEICFKFLGEI